MRTAISIPDQLFLEADRLAKRLGISPSALYRLARGHSAAVEALMRRRKALHERVVRQPHGVEVPAAFDAVIQPADRLGAEQGCIQDAEVLEHLRRRG